MLFVLALTGCGSAGESLPGRPTLDGFWVLAEPSGGCVDEYPTELEFRPDGVYLRSQDPDRPAGPLGGGDYVIDYGENELQLMGPTDAMVRYSYTLTDTELVLTDDNDCTVIYRRQ